MTRANQISGRAYLTNGRAIGGSAIPDSVVSRPIDTGSSSITAEEGLQISLQSDWPSIGAEISTNTSGATRAYLRNNDNTTTIQEVDISSLSSGDAFTFDDVNLTAGDRHVIALDAEGSSWTRGFDTAGNYPYTSTDVDIVAALDQNQGVTAGSSVRVVNNIGNVGFS